MMRSALCKSLDGPAGVDVVSCERPVPGPGQVLLHVHAAALNFLDTLITRGRYQFKPSLPFAPSAEISGVVAEVGEGVTRLGVGERVCGYIGWGGAADYVAADADVLVSVPDAVEHNQAASINVTYGTAMHGFRDRGRLAAGETVAILGASGGAGLAAIEIAALLGARTIAVASSDTKLDVCRRGGADLLLNYKAEDLKQRLSRPLNFGPG